MGMDGCSSDGAYVVVNEIAYKAVKRIPNLTSPCCGCDFFVDGNCECTSEIAVRVCQCLDSIFRRVYGVFVPKANKLPQKFDYAYVKKFANHSFINESTKITYYLEKEINR